MYCCIFHVARKQARKIAVTHQSVFERPGIRHRKRTFTDETKAAKVLCLVLGCFLLTLLPGVISIIIDILFGSVSTEWSYFTNLIAFSNSAMNPLIYTLGTKQVRTALKKRYFKCCNRRPKQTAHCDAVTAVSLRATAGACNVSVVLEDLEKKDSEQCQTPNINEIIYEEQPSP
ncbi:trace amine-associated receptor 8-like [Saccoglossus kowalevskii]|uniref:Trace amine-associated receptor 6-like n=1 Tax=Saccoglossus kowalevskii TaxID=10224 RepID=A0ABM0M4V5_SACKO|nr:PREDICTED: trace amine-associated receptor 6-like [Saccoglossus kowalevskii]